MPIVVLILLGAAFLAGRATSRGDRFNQPQIGRGFNGAPQLRLPSPNRVLDEVVRMGAFPPPHLVRASFEEAQGTGDVTRCQYIVGSFMAPVVAAAAAATQTQTPTPTAPPAGGPASPASPSPSPAPSGGDAGPTAQAAPPQGVPPTAVQVDLPLAGTLVAPPLEGLAPEPWAEFASAIECEAPTYATDRHVGRYRHNRNRLRELGIDENIFSSSLNMQDAALAADVADACARAHASGLTTDFVGSSIEVPSDSGNLSVPVTLSGILGVCHAAGLNGAAGWLTTANDRERFPHTTAAFWRANGVF